MGAIDQDFHALSCYFTLIKLIVIVELIISDFTTYFHVERLRSDVSLSQDLFHALTRDQFVAVFPRVHVSSAISTEKLPQPS